MQGKYIHVLYKNVQQPVILAQALFRFAHAASRFNIDMQSMDFLYIKQPVSDRE